MEVGTTEWGAIPLVVDRAHDRNIRQHPGAFAVRHLLTIGVAGIRYDFEIFQFKGVHCSLGHWLQTPDIRSIEYNACATINACSASTAVWTLYAGSVACRTNI